jgi:hypothetical protein
MRFLISVAAVCGKSLASHHASGHCHATLPEIAFTFFGVWCLESLVPCPFSLILSLSDLFIINKL